MDSTISSIISDGSIPPVDCGNSGSESSLSCANSSIYGSFEASDAYITDKTYHRHGILIDTRTHYLREIEIETDLPSNSTTIDLSVISVHESSLSCANSGSHGSSESQVSTVSCANTSDDVCSTDQTDHMHGETVNTRTNCQPEIASQTRWMIKLNIQSRIRRAFRKIHTSSTKNIVIISLVVTLLVVFGVALPFIINGTEEGNTNFPDSTESTFPLERDQNVTVNWNVNVPNLENIRQLQAKLNGVFRPNGFSTDARLQFFVTIKGYVATCEVMLRPVTYFEDGPWELHMQNVDTRYKRLQEDGLASFTACPDQVTVPVEGQLNLEFRSCIPEGFNSYSVDLYRRTNISGSVQENQNIDISFQQAQFRGILDFNDLSVTLEIRQVKCADYMRNFSLALRSTGGSNSEQFISLANAIGLSTFAACPGQITVLVGGELKLEFISYIPDGFNTYYLDIYGTAHDSGLIPEKASLEMFYGRTYYGVLFYFNELSVTLKLWQVICADHMKSFSLALGTTGRTISEHFHSLPNVIGRYEGFSSGGDFRENSPAIVNLRIHLGCRPQKLKINVNGSYLAETYNITEDESTGEKMFSKSFSFPKISMIDNGTTVFLHSSFIDDQGFPRNISIEQTIRVVPETFCQGKPYGCNYPHPYNANMMVACGEGIIAAFRNCQPGLVFFNSSCVGQCCQEGSTNNCQQT